MGNILAGLVAAPPAPPAPEATPLAPETTPPAPGATQAEKEAATTRPSETGARTDKETVGKASEKGTLIEKETTVKATEKSGRTEPEPKIPTKPNKEFPEQCGFKVDEAGCGSWEGPQRIKTTLATPEQQVKYRAHLAKIFSKESINGVRVRFHPVEVWEVMRDAEQYFKSEPTLIEDVPFGVTIVGDLHGQLYDLCRVFDCHAKDGTPGYERAKYLFLGDYVDRGRQSLEVIMAIFCLKMIYPDNFFPLRGNHEFSAINATNGFFFELLDRYEAETAKTLYWRINDTFNWISLAAIVGDSYFCAHGGISPHALSRAQMRGVMKPILDSSRDALVQDLCWSDPAIGLRGTVFNDSRGASIHYGMDALAKALNTIDCKVLFRGHTVVQSGIDNMWFICITVFTATGHNGEFNNGACIDIEADGSLTTHILEIDMKRTLRDLKWFGKKVKKEEEELTTDGGDGCGGPAGIATIEDGD